MGVTPHGPARGRLLAALPLLAAGSLLAHERFVRHNLKVPVRTEFFGRFPGELLGLHPSMLRIALNTFAVLFAFLFVWFSRHAIVEGVHRVVLMRVGGALQRLGHALSCFVTDRPVRTRVFHAIGEWSVIAFLRSPALVLMYSATNDSLVMPSYPLDPSTATFFKFAQVLLALLILTQTLLPVCGALIIGTWIYLFRWGWMVSVDAVPVLTVAVVYVTSPWNSHKLAITSLNALQVRWARVVLGLGFMTLGWLKVYNYNLVAGVADNFPNVMDDPLLKLFAAGSDPAFRREAWIVAFGLAEVLSGFLLMMGVFTRVWGTVMIFMFTKLLLVDFGWEEIPHIYPITSLLAIVFSNRLESEVARSEERVQHWRREGRVVRLALAVGVPAVVIALLVIFPPLWAISFFDRANL